MRELHSIWGLFLLLCSATAHADEKPQEGEFATTADYPERALRQGREGTVHYSVVVGTDGKAKSCKVVVSSGHHDLDRATCSNIINRARFKPARDADGNPIESTYSNKIVWRIPRQ